MRRPWKQQDRGQMTLAEKSNNYYVNSHGFALSRTVSCKSLWFSAVLCGPLCPRR